MHKKELILIIMYLTVDSLIDTNNITTGSNNCTLRVSYGCDKMYTEEELVYHKMYQSVDQFREIKINHRNFCFALIKDVHPFYDGNGTTCKMLFNLQLELRFFKKRSRYGLSYQLLWFKFEKT